MIVVWSERSVLFSIKFNSMATSHYIWCSYQWLSHIERLRYHTHRMIVYCVSIQLSVKHLFRKYALCPPLDTNSFQCFMFHHEFIVLLWLVRVRFRRSQILSRSEIPVHCLCAVCECSERLSASRCGTCAVYACTPSNMATFVCPRLTIT